MNPFARYPVQLGCDDDCAFERIWLEPPGLYYDGEEEAPRRPNQP